MDSSKAQSEDTPKDGSGSYRGAERNQRETNGGARAKQKICLNGQPAMRHANAGERTHWRDPAKPEPGRRGIANSGRAWGRDVFMKLNDRGRGRVTADRAMEKNPRGGRGGHGRYDANKCQMGRSPDVRGARAYCVKSSSPIKARQSRGLGFRTLQELYEKDPSVVAITLSSHPALKTVLDEPSMRQDLTELLCQVMSKAFQSRTDRSTLQHLAGIIKDSAFLRSNLSLYLSGMLSESNPVRRAQYPQHLDNILSILSEVQSIYPVSSVQTVGMLVTLLQASINKLEDLGVAIQPEIEGKTANLQYLIGHQQERSREGTLKSGKARLAIADDDDDDDDPDGDQQHFRTIPIFPTLEEFHQVEPPFLRRNRTNRRYTNTHIYLDTHFRLLREDFVRPLREGIQQILADPVDVGMNENLQKKRFDDIRVYFNAKLMAPKCTKTGLAYVIQFDTQQLKFVCWENSKRLIYGSLVCLSSDHFQSFLFATVSDRDPKDLRKGQVDVMFTEESKAKLASIEENEIFLMVETTAYFEAYRHVLEGLQEQEEVDLPFQRYIVECNKELEPPDYLRRNDVYDLSSIADPHSNKGLTPFPSLVPNAWPAMEKLGLDESQMKALQLALTKELAIIQGPPGTGKTYVGLKIAQALLTNSKLWCNHNDHAPMLVVCYTNHALDQFLEGIHQFLRNGIVRVGGRSNSETLKKFNLRELTSSHHFRNTLPAHLQTAHNLVYKELCDVERELQKHTIKMQCSLKGVLRETFLKNCISQRHWNSLHLKTTQEEFVEWNQRKHSVIMEWLGLDSTAVLQGETENEDEYPDEEMELGYIKIEEEADWIQADRIIEDWSFPHRGEKVDRKKRLELAVREVEQLMLAVSLDHADTEVKHHKDEDGFQLQKQQKKKMRKLIRKELEHGTSMTEEEEHNVLNVWTLSQKHRWRLYRLWCQRYRKELRANAQTSEVAFENVVNRLADIKRRETLCVLKKAKVIGMTTTGAAKFRKELQEVRPRLVIVEEAAEVLEAHIITAISNACQHLILIGDHQQLRPSASVYDLAKNFNLEMSMFERLVKMELPFVRLDYQHRMRSEIARLLTPHIYSELENHPSVFNYENIKGLNTNLFFVEHSHLEDEIKDGKSHRNQHEATFVVALCRYLLLQDYKPDQITILTTYTGQLHHLRRLMPAKEFTGVKVHVVDKYQGEENDIVLLSLVRSNRQGKVGFLSIPNRVCVALSRAKKGLYCIGNSEILRTVKLWGDIFHTLSLNKQIGKGLTLCCQNHPDQKAFVLCAEDFKQAPEGGCTKPCQFRLDCGHVCSSVCHPYDPMHKKFKCGKPCQKILCDQGHPCKLLCHEECPSLCTVNVEKIVPECQHTQMIPCHQDPATFSCQRLCPMTLPCGHIQQCFCFFKKQEIKPQCRTECRHQLKCGHACQGTCGSCLQGRYHSLCPHPCERLLVCSHKCSVPCTRDCPPCQRPCENCCVHSQCKKKCGQACSPCVEPCAWQCQHQRCTKLCHEPCDRPPCTKPCDKTLACGHPCIGLCGDKCPKKCRVCDHEEVTEIFFGTEDEPDAYFIELEDCGHIVEYTAMDKYMKLDDDDQATNGQGVAIKLKECPKCRTPIRKNLRYGSSINRRLADIELVKQKMNGHQPDLRKHRETLMKQWDEASEILENHFVQDFGDIKVMLEEHNLARNDLWILENKIDFLLRVGKLLRIVEKDMLPIHALKFKLNLSEFVYRLKHRNQNFTDQQVFDLERELQRLHLLAKLNACRCKAEHRKLTDEIQCDVQILQTVLEMPGQFSDKDECRVRETLNNLTKKIPLIGLGISEEERKMIVSAMKMQPGHWHKCPNGHVYVITECGGAMQRRKCPDCDATIGGQDHRLDSGNVVATEMDGARHSAWSEVNNLHNFNPFDI